MCGRPSPRDTGFFFYWLLVAGRKKIGQRAKWALLTKTLEIYALKILSILSFICQEIISLLSTRGEK